MARKLSSSEFMGRHLKEVDAVLGLFKNKQELRYAEIRKKLSLDRKSLDERKSKQAEKDKSGRIKHETQLIRVLDALCKGEILQKKSIDKKTYYHLILSGPAVEEINLRNRIASDPAFYNRLLEDKGHLENQLEQYKNRIYELNLEIGRYTRENIELKEQLARLKPSN